MKNYNDVVLKAEAIESRLVKSGDVEITSDVVRKILSDNERKAFLDEVFQLPSEDMLKFWDRLYENSKENKADENIAVKRSFWETLSNDPELLDSDYLDKFYEILQPREDEE